MNTFWAIFALASVPLATAAVDEYMSCDRFFESKRTARYLEEIPCDMSKQGYCAHKGTAYPEAQIWNFKEDNRALMKRLYGEMEPSMLQREMRSVNLPSASNIPSLEHHVFSSLEYNIRVGSGLATVASAREPVVGQEDEKHTAQKKHKVIVKRKKKKPVQHSKKPTAAPASDVQEEPAMSRTGNIELPTFPQSRLKTSGIEAEEESTETTQILTEGTDTSTVSTVIPDLPTTIPTDFETTTESIPETETESVIVSVSLTTSEEISSSNALQTPVEATSNGTESDLNVTVTSTTLSNNITAPVATTTSTPVTSTPLTSESETVEMTDTTETVTETVLDTTLPVESTSQSSTTAQGPYFTSSDILSLEKKPVNPDPVDNFLHSFSEMLAQSEPTSVSASTHSTQADNLEQPSGPAVNVVDVKQPEAEMKEANSKPSLSDILADVDLDSLEKIVGELLPSQEQDANSTPAESVPQVLEAGSHVLAQPSPQVSNDFDHVSTQPEQETIDRLDSVEGNDEEFEEIVEYVTDDELELMEAEEELVQAEQEPEVEEEIQYTGQAVNACPVKEEVFAPYWANNTRNQVLALLNLYPFEQYIHMETCKFEEEQMLCRRGCRCEQQYRLHRLLAFDPNNECRGIFSDWFRFPSYCICKCYNFPDEYVANPPKASKRKKRVDQVNRQSSNSKKMQHPKATREFRNFEMEPAEAVEEKTAYVLPELQSRDIASNVVEHSPRVMVPGSNPGKPTEEKFFYASAPVSEYVRDGTEEGHDSEKPRK